MPYPKHDGAAVAELPASLIDTSCATVCKTAMQGSALLPLRCTHVITPLSSHPGHCAMLTDLNSLRCNLALPEEPVMEHWLADSLLQTL